MCHEYGAMWRKSETKPTSKTKDIEASAPRTVAARQEEKPAPEHKAEKKELVPAE